MLLEELFDVRVNVTFYVDKVLSSWWKKANLINTANILM